MSSVRQKRAAVQKEANKMEEKLRVDSESLGKKIDELRVETESLGKKIDELLEEEVATVEEAPKEKKVCTKRESSP